MSNLAYHCYFSMSVLLLLFRKYSKMQLCSYYYENLSLEEVSGAYFYIHPQLKRII